MPLDERRPRRFRRLRDGLTYLALGPCALLLLAVTVRLVFWAAYTDPIGRWA